MIIDMPDTRTRDIAQKIDELHEERGESATSRVLTLLIDTDDTQLEAALTVANGASREHPCRVIAIVPGRADGPRDSGHDSNLDAQVRFGADAGAGEIIILRPRGGLIDHPDTLVIPLLVPDTPIVTWWPTNPPEHPARHPLGAMARKITLPYMMFVMTPTLLIDTDDTQLEAALTVANGASREHPCRVIAIVPGRADGPRDSGHDSNLDAQVRFGADAGAGEIIILRPRGGLIDHPDTLVIPLLVPDTPIVTWWPTNPPEHPARHPLGAMARSRITDAMRSDDPESTMRRLHDHWSPADVDLSWTRPACPAPAAE